MKTKFLILTSAVLLVVLLIAGSCARRLLTSESISIWTPAPVSGAPLVATRSADILPTLASPVAARPTQPVPTQPIQPVIAPSPTVQFIPEPGLDPKLVHITEEDVLRAVAAGIAAQEGVSLEGVGVDFADEKMFLSAARLAYGAIEVRNLQLVGRLTASEGRLRLDTESITPGGLVTALIPTFANQALAQYTSQWYVEEVRALDGRLELRIR